MDDIGPLISAIDSADAKGLHFLLSSLIRDCPQILECVKGDESNSNTEESETDATTSNRLLSQAMLSADTEGQRSMLITVSVVFPETNEALERYFEEIASLEKNSWK